MRTFPAAGPDLTGDRGVTWGEAAPRVYLAGPRTCLDPDGSAALAATLLDLGLIDARPAEAFVAAAAALRAAGADVTSPAEAPWWCGAETDIEELRAGRAADAAARAAADLVVVLDGWLDVPGAVDGPVITARTAGVPVVSVADALALLAATGSSTESSSGSSTESAALHRRPAA